jgi:hypothetical protein
MPPDPQTGPLRPGPFQRLIEFGAFDGQTASFKSFEFFLDGFLYGSTAVWENLQLD